MTYSVRQLGTNALNLIWLKCPLRILATEIILLSFINQNTIFAQVIHVLVSRPRKQSPSDRKRKISAFVLWCSL